MIHNTLLTRYSKENKVYLLGTGSRRTRTTDAMRTKRREGWLQHCPLSYDQARCIHSPFVEYYAIQAFSIASDLDLKLMPKEQYQITMKFASLYNPFFRVVQIIILTKARIGRNTTRFSPFLECCFWFKKKTRLFFGCWCHYAFSVTVSWCYAITREWWLRVHLIHSGNLSLSSKSNLMHIAPWSEDNLRQLSNRGQWFLFLKETKWLSVLEKDDDQPQ